MPEPSVPQIGMPANAEAPTPEPTEPVADPEAVRPADESSDPEDHSW